jgi:hypothetical protein
MKRNFYKIGPPIMTVEGPPTTLQRIVVTNTGTIPATNLSLFLISSPDITNITNQLSTVNGSALTKGSVRKYSRQNMVE